MNKERILYQWKSSGQIFDDNFNGHKIPHGLIILLQKICKNRSTISY